MDTGHFCLRNSPLPALTLPQEDSSDFFKVYNNRQLQLAQKSQFGVPFGPVVVSGIGQADGVALVANDLYDLQGLLDLSLHYCAHHHVQLSQGKTKLQVFSSSSSRDEAFFGQVISQVNINGEPISFVEAAEHVGTLRSTSGNLPHIQSRFTAHRKSMFAILPVGLAKSNRGNPAAALRVHQVYGSPVLLSGMNTLLLKKSENGI